MQAQADRPDVARGRRLRHLPGTSRVLPAARPAQRAPSPALLAAATVGLALLAAPGAAASVVINEYQASNVDCLHDAEWNTPDWIELYNNGDDAVNLLGFGLSDREREPFKWVFPEYHLPGGGRVLVFASDRDRYDTASHWETVVDRGDLWRYRVNTSPLPAGWTASDFDDSAWEMGPSGFGYGDDDDATIVPECRSLSARIYFHLDDPAAVRMACLHVDYDDGFVAWINGVEVARRMMGAPGAVPAWNKGADDPHEAQIYQGYAAETFILAPAGLPLRAGENVLAVAVHNALANEYDMSLIPILTLGFDAAPAAARGVSDLVRPWLPHLETNFKIDADGETLVLTDAAGRRLDRVETGAMTANTSRGRMPDGADGWRFFEEPTPDAPNGDGQSLERTDPPEISMPGGFYSGPLTVTIAAPSAQARIFYTLDASEPSESSAQYAAPIEISATSVLRAVAIDPGARPSAIATCTYVMEPEPELPVFCLVTDPINLWDEDVGIYVLGPDAWPTYPYWGANYWKDWERPVHVEFLDPLGDGFRLNLGLRIHGSSTRTFPQKSLRLIARGGYDVSAVEYPLFPDLDVQRFERIVLRNAGNDWCRAHLRDGLLHVLAAPLGIDTQAYRPAIVYLNGVYWGIQNIREKADAYYLQDHYGVDPDDVDLQEGNRVVIEGDTEHYDELLAYIGSHDLSDDAVFDEVAARMDVEEFARFYIFRVFAANTDWPGNNMLYWRPRTAQGRWRWILYDAEWGLGLNDSSYAHNTLAWALSAKGGNWQHAPWSTYLARKLLENEGYRRYFVNVYADYLNSVFRPECTLPILHQLADAIADEIPRHMRRWGYNPGIWTAEIATIEEFLRQRPAYARMHLMQQFGLADTIRLALDVSPPGAGTIRMNSVAIDSAWTGIYFAGVPVQLTAEPAPGMRFRGWSDNALPADAVVEIAPAGDYALTAAFAPDPGGACYWMRPIPNPIRIGAELTFFLRQKSRAKVAVYDVTGRQVAAPATGEFTEGEHPVAWTGTNGDGRQLASGVYFLWLEVEGATDVQRLVVVR